MEDALCKRSPYLEPDPAMRARLETMQRLALRRQSARAMAASSAPVRFGLPKPKTEP